MKKVLKLMTLLVSVLAMSVVGGGQAFAAWYPSQTTAPNVMDHITSLTAGMGITGVSDLKDLKETSSLVASKTWPGWYYTSSDRVKFESEGLKKDDYTACTSVTPTSAKDDCRMRERAKVWMVHMAYITTDPNYRKIDQVKAFPISNSAWAYDKTIAFNGDWEDMTQGPVRTVGGVSTNSLLIAATGKDSGGPTNCSNRRVIEFNELNPYSPAGTTWSPTYIYDLDGAVIDNDQIDCNIEAMWLDFDGTTPYAHLMTYGTTSVAGVPTFGTDSSNTEFKRVLTTTSGRAASTGFNNGVRINPSSTEFQRVGRMAVSQTGKRYQISGAGFQESNDDLVLISSKNKIDDTVGCQLLMWHSRSYTTTVNPNEYANCNLNYSGTPAVSGVTEGIAYVYSTDPSIKGVHVLYDEDNSPSWHHKYYYWQ